MFNLTAIKSEADHASVLAENEVKMLVLLNDISRNAIFPDRELDLHKQNRKQTYMVQHSQPAYMANEEYRKVLFGDGPYAHVGPTMESIDKLDRKALDAFLQKRPPTFVGE